MQVPSLVWELRSPGQWSPLTATKSSRTGWKSPRGTGRPRAPQPRPSAAPAWCAHGPAPLPRGVPKAQRLSRVVCPRPSASPAWCAQGRAPGPSTPTRPAESVGSSWFCAFLWNQHSRHQQVLKVPPLPRIPRWPVQHPSNGPLSPGSLPRPPKIFLLLVLAYSLFPTQKPARSLTCT